MKKDKASEIRFYSLLTLVTLICIYLANNLDIHPDEAYYFSFSEFLNRGYLDHPPMIAYTIRISRLIFPGNFQIRGVNLILAFSALILMYRSLLIISDNIKAAHLATLLSALSPIFITGAVITTPDTPLIFSISAYIFFVLMAIKSRTGYRYGVLSGIMLGSALLSKYTAFSIYLSLVLLWFLIKERRQRINLIYLPVLISFAIYSPNLLYNIETGFRSYLFQIYHATSNPAFTPHRTFVAFLLSQTFIFSPFLFIFYFTNIFKKPEERDSLSNKFLKVTALLPFTILLCLSIFKNVEPNWSSFVFVPLVILTANSYFENKVRSIIALGYQIIIFVLIILHVNFHILPLKPAIDPLTSIKDWEKTVRLIRENLPQNRTVVAFRYQICSELYYYSKREIMPLCLDRRFIDQEIRLSDATSWAMVDLFPAKSALEIILNICPESSIRIPLVISENLNILRRVDILYCR